VIVRGAVPADKDAIFALLRELGYDALRGDDVWFRRVIEHAEMRVVVAEDGGLVGVMTLSLRPQLRIEGIQVNVDELVVTEHVRGTGVGRALLHEAKRIANELDARRVELTTIRGRESYERHFYEKNGFVEINSAVMRITR
jgi:N-acetylglutamate synthase-like GNAT family acetyltransferase